jgi:hypothetical protein
MEHDPFIKGLKERLPDDLKDSFTKEQLMALKVAFGARQWGQHPLDLRGTFKLWRWRYYFVLLAGRNRRANETCPVSQQPPHWQYFY